MSDKLFKEIFNNTYTKNDFYQRSLLLKEFFEYLFFSDHGKETHKDILKNFLKDKEISKELSDVMNSWSDLFYTSFTSENFNTLIDEIEKEFEKLPIVVMYVPISLPFDEIKKLGEWVRTNITANVLMDVKVDPEVVGGCAFVWNGVYHDFSLKYFFDKKVNDIVTMVRNYSDE